MNKRQIQDTSFESSSPENKQSTKIRNMAPEPISMQTILEEMRNMNEKMNQRLDKNKDEMKQCMYEGFEQQRQEINVLKQEIKEIKEINKMKEEEWKNEKEQIMEHIAKLENQIEYLEKKEKRNNIVIKNMQIKNGNVKEEVGKFIKEYIGVDANITEAERINYRTIKAKIQDAEQKEIIMKAKSKLKDTKIFIESELTRNEMSIQKQLYERAKDEREKGATVKIGYKRLSINGRMIKWEEMQQQRANPKNQIAGTQ